MNKFGIAVKVFGIGDRTKVQSVGQVRVQNELGPGIEAMHPA
ncbi:hypothetical protein LF1_55440 [Rubripirellula obstinata]|uniref:Uncharacterized protein n=1 Tax=Rubripirellula obstinata TaxID=406547 RepID=A0A5B1CCS4_9BACT|nr:hypothetical protein LF1_55440 [Rubripirellula obstinata]